LNGSIPSYSASSLRSLDVRYNNLSGVLPYLPPSIESFSADGNTGITGEIPMSWSYHSFLSTISLQQCSLSGELPSSLPSTIKVAWLNGNNFTGDIPSYNDTTLQWLYVSDNSLERLPDNPPLTLIRFHASNNNLRGNISDNFGNLSLLEQLVLEDNHLTGTIPSSLFTLPSMSMLYLRNNDLMCPETGSPTSGFSW